MISLDKQEIENLLPHRDPMLLIDELHDIKKLTSATGIVNVKKDSFFVQGHFPGQPVMPGVLIVEAFGQTAAALTAHGIDKSTYENKQNIKNTSNKLEKMQLFQLVGITTLLTVHTFCYRDSCRTDFYERSSRVIASHYENVS